ncbi:response regulator transcription factor [Chryseobacterium oryctis]|uniref:Response regulator transcription factor n=1 Tax=Chryseobacterium oryctis TaxID=2952618 RepID=A0ABT3HSK1_9FLAO|nr:response regulator transcription factor [Chryseobacterium oryctis]MCW3162759.1 response regulator transcription factor [Chryseobacterium oryctis]
MSLKILIADDHYIVRVGTSLLLQSTYPDAEIGFAENYEQVKKKITSERYDLLLLDIDMPGSLYKKMIGDLKNLKADLKILIFSGYKEKIAVQYIREGANGFINKESFEDEIINAIENVIQSGFYYPADLVPLLAQQTTEIDPMSLLSIREYEIFELFAKGNGNLEICNILNLQMSTVSTYKKRVFEKLEVKNIAELIKIYESLH